MKKELPFRFRLAIFSLTALMLNASPVYAQEGYDDEIVVKVIHAWTHSSKAAPSVRRSS